MVIPTQLVVRASTLSSYHDCPRRAASRFLRQEILDAGYTLHNTKPHIGAAVGSGVHGGMKYSLTAKMLTGTLGDGTAAAEQAIESFRFAAMDGVTWDDTTRDVNTAEKQVLRATVAFRTMVAPTIQPNSIEVRLSAEWKPGVVITGEPDWSTQDNALGDLKNGTASRYNAAQYGAYAWLMRSMKGGMQVTAIEEAYIPRTKITKEQPIPHVISYVPEEAETLAASVLERIVSDVERFRESQLPSTFPANPMSALCSPKYCPAFGSDFCKTHKKG